MRSLRKKTAPKPGESLITWRSVVRIHSPLLNKPETPSLAFIFRFIIACGVGKLGDGILQMLTGLGNGEKKTV